MLYETLRFHNGSGRVSARGFCLYHAGLVTGKFWGGAGVLKIGRVCDAGHTRKYTCVASMSSVVVRHGSSVVTVFPRSGIAMTPDGTIFASAMVHYTGRGGRRMRDHHDLTRVSWTKCTEIDLSGRGSFLTLYLTDEEGRTLTVTFLADVHASNVLRSQVHCMGQGVRRLGLVVDFACVLALVGCSLVWMRR